MRNLSTMIVMVAVGVSAGYGDDVATPQAAKPPAPIQPVDPAGYWLSPKAFRAATEKVLPSVVTIETYGGINPSSGPAPKQPPAGRPAPGQRRPAGMQGISKPGEGPTTGVVIGEDGTIITSTFNFIRKPDIITVVLHDGSQHVAKMLGKDETRKLCLLKIDLPEGRRLPVPPFAEAHYLTVGQWSISVGVGYGVSDPAISAGIISARNRMGGKAVQTDANISPANYGGPLIDLDGKVIGICVPLSPQGGGAAAGVEWYDSGIGFAIPLTGLERRIEEMKQGKTILPGRMGVVPGGEAAGGGVTLTQVAPGSGAEKAGLKPLDIVIKLNGETIKDAMHVRTLLGKFIAGDVVKVTFKRAGKEMEADVTLTSGEPDVDNPTLPPALKPAPAPAPEKKPE